MCRGLLKGVYDSESLQTILVDMLKDHGLPISDSIKLSLEDVIARPLGMALFNSQYGDKIITTIFPDGKLTTIQHEDKVPKEPNSNPVNLTDQKINSFDRNGGPSR